MAILNKLLKIVFIASAALLLASIVTLPKTHCEACHFEFLGHEYDGIKAFEVFESACVSYKKPWDSSHAYIDIDDINVTMVGDGTYIINFSEEVLG